MRYCHIHYKYQNAFFGKKYLNKYSKAFAGFIKNTAPFIFLQSYFTISSPYCKIGNTLHYIIWEFAHNLGSFCYFNYIKLSQVWTLTYQVYKCDLRKTENDKGTKITWTLPYIHSHSLVFTQNSMRLSLPYYMFYNIFFKDITNIFYSTMLS
jgi:hypothetical protein